MQSGNISRLVEFAYGAALTGRGFGMGDFRIDIDDLVDYGAGLVRPECVLCLKSGTVFTSNGDGGVTRIDADGTCRHILADGYRPMTNGFALTAEGDFLLADLHGDGVWRLGQDGACAPFLREVDGMRLGSTNFVGVDPKGRIWAAVSTRREPRQRAYRGDVADGYIVLVDGDGARIVADNIGYTNESIVDPSGEWLVVNETFVRRGGRHRWPGPWVRRHARRGSGRRSCCAMLSKHERGVVKVIEPLAVTRNGEGDRAGLESWHGQCNQYRA